MIRFREFTAQRAPPLLSLVVMQQRESPLKCRHCDAPWEWDWEYCPECHRNFGGAVYPDQHTPEELAKVERLIEQIHAAFSGTLLEDGTTSMKPISKDAT